MLIATRIVAKSTQTSQNPKTNRRKNESVKDNIDDEATILRHKRLRGQRNYKSKEKRRKSAKQ